MTCSCSRIAGIGQKTVAAGGDVNLLGSNSMRRGLTLSPQAANSISVSFGQPGINNPKFVWAHVSEQSPLFITEERFGDALQKDIWIEVGAGDVISYVEIFHKQEWEANLGNGHEHKPTI